MRPIRYGDIRQILTSVADTTVTITSPTKRHFLIAGTAAMYVLVLPDARTIRSGTPFVFENSSSEFVGVRNSDSTTWHRVPPRATLTCVLATQATAAGTWYSMVHDPAVGNPAFGLEMFSDFSGFTASNSYYSESGFGGPSAGAGAAVTFANASPAGKQGVAKIDSGTTAAGYSLMVNPYVTAAVILLGSGCRSMEVSQNLTNASTAADEYIARFGFGNNTTGGAHTEGAYFLYDRLTAGITNWQCRTCKTAGGAASTQTDSGVVPVYSATLSQKLRIEINSTDSRADFWIDNVQVSAAGGLATLPAVTTGIKLYIGGITRSAYTAIDHFATTDYVRVQSYPTTPR